MRNPRKRAFTLVELLVVIAILAILATVSVTGYTAFIQKANISADEQEIAQLKVHLDAEGAITSEQQLANLVDEAFGAGTYATLEPRSVQYGYHYWYDVENNQIVLKTYQDVVAQNDAKMRKNVTGGGTRDTYSQVAPASAQPSFVENEQQNFRLFGNYFVLDGSGSVVAQSIGALNLCQNVSESVNALVNVKQSSKDKQFANAVLGKLAQVAIVCNDETFVYDANSVSTFIFAPDLETVSSNVVYHNATSNYVAKATIVQTITLPQTVTRVEENSLFFDVANSVKIITSLQSMDEIAQVFQANSTNGIVVVNGDNQYTINGGTLEDVNGDQVGNLEYTNPVESFNIVTPADTDDYKTVVDMLYVAYNYTGNIQLSANDFKNADGADLVSSTDVVWSCDHSNVQISTNGKLSIVGVPALRECEAKITATAVAGGATQTLTVYVVRPTSLSVGFANSTYQVSENSDATNVVLTYTNESGVDFPLTIGMLQDNFEGQSPIQINADVEISVGQGNVFSIENNVLKLLNPTGVAGQTQTFTVSVANGLLSKTFVVSVDDQSATPFQKNNEIAERENSFLFRVGNGNAIPLGYFFTNENPADTTLTILDYAGTGLTATLNENSGPSWNIEKSNWTTLPILFQGTGVAKIIIGDDKLGTTTIMVEVVDGKNVTEYSQLKSSSNYVLLNDIEMSDNDRFALQNGTLYGNDFTFDVTKGNYTAVRIDANGKEHSELSANYRILLNNGVLDNVRIVGNAFDGFSATKDNPLNICNVLSKGNNKIINSYISYCAAPVRLMGGQLEIIGTTLRGGSIANLDIREGTVILDNVTTINQRTLNSTLQPDEAVGLGIMVWYEGVTNVDIVIRNSLTQFNTMSKEDFLAIPIKYGDLSVTSYFANEIFDKNNGTGQFIYEKDGKQWINTGIFAMTDAVTSDSLRPDDSFSGKEDYDLQTVSITVDIPFQDDKTFAGWLYSIDGQSAVNTEKDYHRNYVYNYASQGQGTIFPSYNVELGDDLQNRIDGSNEYCFKDANEKILISFDEGGDKELSIGSLCTATKGSCILTLKEIKIYKDGALISNDTTAIPQSIKFDSTGEYVLEYVFEDKFNYNANGSPIIKEHTKDVLVSVVEVEPETKHAEFYFFEDENYAGKTVTIGNTTYLTLDIDEATDVASTNGTQYMTLNDGKRVNKTTISGITIYYPVIDMVMSDGTTSHTSGWYAYFYVFNGVVEIVDYDTSGEAITYNKSKQDMPSGLTVHDPAKTFKYSSAASADTIPSVKKNYLCYSSAKIEANRSEESATAMYTYKDNAGSSYSYYVGYYAPAQSYTNGCVTPDTLVTLADGTQKQIQHVTYQDKLLVWNFNTGCYAEKPASAIINHGEDYYTVVTLKFSDGTTIDVIDQHGFFDLNENKFVFIGENNVENYIRHTFVQQSTSGYNTVELVGYAIAEQYTTAYSILSHEYDNAFVEGMLSITPFPGIDNEAFYGCLVVGDNLIYDFEAIQKYVDKHGLYTYEELSAYGVSHDQFVGANLAYLKIMVGEGIVTLEEAMNILSQYVPQ